jgi:K+-transporting ATPase KdpF subunit
MTLLLGIGAFLSFFLLVYLLAALLWPEKWL